MEPSPKRAFRAMAALLLALGGIPVAWYATTSPERRAAAAFADLLSEARARAIADGQVYRLLLPAPGRPADLELRAPSSPEAIRRIRLDEVSLLWGPAWIDVNPLGQLRLPPGCPRARAIQTCWCTGTRPAIHDADLVWTGRGGVYLACLVLEDATGRIGRMHLLREDCAPPPWIPDSLFQIPP